VTTNPLEVIEHLARVTSDHDVDAIVACFAEDYLNQTPAHPLRGFRGRDQVRRNWGRILGGVPDLEAVLLATVVDGCTVWSEWLMSGTRRDGAEHEMRGVIIFAIQDGLIGAARFYLEPVERGSGTADEAVSRAVTTAPDLGSRS
jgi:ketosteroid isomerase-like protein